MVELDWELIKSADVTALANDEDAAEEYFGFLSKGLLGKERNPELLTKLFEVTRVVMNMKAVQYEVAVDEIEKITHEVASDKEKTLLSKIQLLQSQLEQYQKHAGTGENYFRSEIFALEQKNKLLEQEIIEANNRLKREQNTYDRITQEMQQLETKYIETKRKFDLAQSDILEYQRQFQSQRENMTTRRTDVDEIREQISKKNREMSQYLDDIKQLQDENDRLVNDIGNVKKELEQATEDMNNITDDYSKLKVILEDTDAILEEMRKERDILRSQIQDMTVQLQKQTEGDDKIMNELNQKVLQWKDILSSKDQEIANLKLENFNLEKQLRTAQLDSDHNNLFQLAEANKKKDEKIKELKEKLQVATKDYNEYIEHINTLKKTSKDNSSLFQQKMIKKLNQSLQQEQMSTMVEKQRIIEVEQDILEKDRQITELTNRLIQYEQGQYGLSEAVQEIKECRVQIRMRDRNIEEITSKANVLNEEVDVLTLENEEMRERLGIESRDMLDVSSLRKKRAVKEEQAHSLNRVLQREIEVLEEERVQLKKALRNQALERGKRAVELGLSSEYLEEPYELSVASPKSKIIKKPFQVTENISSKESSEDSTRINFLEDQNKILEQQKKLLEEENKILKEETNKLEIGLREINGALKSGNTPMVLQVPALDTLIAIIEQRHATGQYDTTLQLKAQLNNLAGRNDELRSELQTARGEITKLATELDRKIFKIDALENEILNLNESRENVIKINPLPLPAGVNPTSKDIIACLNEYLIQVLQELSNKEEICNQMEQALEDCRRKYSVLGHQQSILYQEHIQLKMQTEEEKLNFDKTKEELLQKFNEDQVRLQEFDSFLERLNSDPDDHKRLLVEMTRKMTVMAVNLKSITRKYAVIQDVEKNLRKENSKIRKDAMDMEASITNKIGELERYKAMCVYKISALQKSLDDSVPSSELELANRQFYELTSKYRDLLQRDNFLVERTSALEALQADLKALHHANITIKESLLLEKERSYVLQQTLNDLLIKMGKEADGETYKSEEICSLARKLATLEMKELNEREKADHALQKYEQLKCLVNELENRNADLEKKFADISKLNLEAQRIEQELSHELANCVPSEVNRVDKQQILKLEEQLAQLTFECSRLKEIADVAQHQTEIIQVQLTSQEKELISLRKQLYQQQMETDEKTIIAKLHHQIIALQVSEATAVHKLQVVSAKLTAKEIEILKLQNLQTDQTESIFHIRSEGRSKIMFLKKMVQDLRRQFSGALPIAQQERFSETLRSLQEKKIELEKELGQAHEKRSSAEALAMEFKLKLDGLQELIATLKDGQGAKKVVEWHNRMSEVKLDDMKLNHQIMQLKEKVIYLERIKTKHENSIALLEELSVKQSKGYEDRQLLWEQHEVELERKIAMLEKQQQEIMDAAKKFEEATGSIPNDTLPIANQLDIAVGKIKEHIKTIIVTKAEMAKMAEKLQLAEEKILNAENALLQKDKVINELRIRLPLHNRDVKLVETETNSKESREVQYAVRVAQATIDSLKLMLAKKDENLAKYQNMLNQSREEVRILTEAHRHEIKLLQERLQLEIDEHIKKVKKIHEDYINIPQPPVATSQQLARLAELEEVIKEQDITLGTVSVKYQHSLLQVKQTREDCEQNLKRQQVQFENQSKEFAIELNKLRKEIEVEKNIIREKDLEIEVLNQELESAKAEKEAAPSKTMKNLVERLRDQLVKKDKEHKALSQALVELRADMVTTAEENVQAYAKKVEGEMSVQLLIDKETAQLNSRIEDLQNRLKALQAELKKKKEEDACKTCEVDLMKKDIQKKDNALKEMAVELKEKEKALEKLEKSKFEKEKWERQSKPVIASSTNKSSQPLSEQIDMTDLDERPVKETKDQVVRWEESKKWQKKIETLTLKLKEKSEEAARAEKTNSMLRESLARIEKEKLHLQSRLKSLSRNEIEPMSVDLHHEQIVADLKTKIFQLENENNELYKQVAFDNQKEVQELRLINNQLKESLQDLEIKLKQDQDSAASYVPPEEKYQKEIIEVRKENMELQFDIERALKDAPRLKARIADLTEYNEILKAEMDSLKGKQKKVANDTSNGIHSVEEMERVIAAMRRVVERLQTENDNFKKQTGKSKPHAELVKENRNLKQEIQRMKQLQTNENKRHNVPASTNKIMIQENEKLLKDLQKEREEVEKLRVNNQSLTAINNKLKENINEKDQALSEMEQKLGNITDGVKSPGGIITNKLYDGKIKALENKITKKNSILIDMKSHMRKSAEREAELLRKIEELEEKILLLQDAPVGEGDDSKQQLQQSRLVIDRLEKENKQLRFELERLRKLTNSGQNYIDVTQDEVLAKLERYDRMIAIEVELRTKLKSVEVEKEKYKNESIKLKKELSAFDPAFFEELEDLKYNYKQALEQNILYEQQLRELTNDFSAHVRH